MTEDGSTPDWRIDTAYWPGPYFVPDLRWHEGINALGVSMEHAKDVVLQFGRAVGRVSLRVEAMEAICKAYGLDPDQIVMHSRLDSPSPDKRKEGALRWASRSRTFPTSRQSWERRRR